jgi:hypothetical protein
MVPTYRVCITSRCDVIKRRAPVYGYGSMLRLIIKKWDRRILHHSYSLIFGKAVLSTLSSTSNSLLASTVLINMSTHALRRRTKYQNSLQP